MSHGLTSEPNDGTHSTNGSEQECQSDGGGNVMSRLMKLSLKVGYAEGNAEEIDGIASPRQPPVDQDQWLNFTWLRDHWMLTRRRREPIG